MRPKIVVITSQTTEAFAGGHSFLERLIDGLAKNYEFVFIGKDKHWLKMFKDRQLETYQNVCGFEPVTLKNLCLVPISILMGLWFFLKQYKTLKEAQVLVFNASFTETFFLLPWIRIFLRTKIIHMRHGGKVPTVFTKTFVGKILIWLWGSDTVTFVSHSQMREWQSFGLKPKNARVIYNGISVSELKAKPENPKDAREITFGFLGRLEEEKGLLTLLDALQDDKLKEINLRLKIAGDGSLKQLIEDITIKDRRLEYLGSIRDVGGFLESLDALVVPSKRESFGLVVCEAWERGVPVICSDIPVFKELKSFAGEKERELTFEIDNPKKLVEQILNFCQNSDNYQNSNYRQHLHNLVKDNFSADNMTTEYANIFQ